MHYRRNFAIQALVATVILILVALPVDGDKVPALEESIFETINGAPGWLYRPFWPFMQFGNLLALPVVAVVMLFMKRWKVALGLLVAMVAKLQLGAVVKDNVVRHRPAALLEDVTVRDDTGLGLAFVSGHVVVAVAIALIVHPWVSRGWRIVLWSLVAIVAVGRLYVGAHLPLDVVGGAALGWAIGAAITVVIGPPRRIRSRRSERAVLRPSPEASL
ncbi:MAG TPA: phosphatase PAP2 family protein [Actinomycetota bacterium]|nr:phosphatase PAP2 family protein [Actinomycetota bacterium]